MSHNIFEMPALTLLVNPDALELKYTHSTLLSCENIDTAAEPFPYGDFLNQCIAFDVNHWQPAFDELTHALPHADDMDDLRGGINMLRRRVNSEFEQHLDHSLEFHLQRILNSPADKRGELFAFEVRLLTYPTGQALLNWLIAAGCLPFFDASPMAINEAKQELSDTPFMPPVFATESRVLGFVLTDILETSIKTFIWHMRSNSLYLHQCSICKTWFVRLNKHKAAFCGGSYCRTKPKGTPKERLTTKVKTMPHWTAHRTEYNFWTQRKRRGQLTQDQFKAWQKEAARQRKAVDADKLSSSKYIDWLLRCRKKAEKVGPDTQTDFWNATF